MKSMSGYLWRVFVVCVVVVGITVCAFATSESRNVKTGKSSRHMIRDGHCGEHCTWKYDADTFSLTISGEGKMEEFSSDKLPHWHPTKGYQIQRVVIEEGVTSVSDYAFDHCKNITSVKLPSSLKSIGDNAFFSCGDLASITLPSGIASIGFRAFSFCSSLASIIIPSSVESIGNNAFDTCNSLSSIIIETGIISIGYQAFGFCTCLTSITIPSSVKSLGSYAFSGCSSLETVEILSPLKSINDGTFRGCGFSSIAIPSSVRFIGHHAFSGCKNLSSIVIPHGVTSIDYSTFQECASLRSVTIPSTVTSIGDRAFYSCEELSSVTIPSSVSVIQSYAFSECQGLNSVTYLGTKDPGPNSEDVFSNFSAHFFVPIDYVSSNFCGKRISLNKESVDAVRRQHNHCYAGVVDGSDYRVQKRINATDWESQTNDCMKYECHNESGGIQWTMCNSSAIARHICFIWMDASDYEKCTNEEAIDSDGWRVEIEFDGVNASQLNKTEILELIGSVDDVDFNKLEIGTEFDDKGQLILVIVFVEDKESAERVSNTVKNCTELSALRNVHQGLFIKRITPSYYHAH